MKEFEAAFPISAAPTREQLVAAAARALGVSPAKVSQLRILRRSLDARGEILYRYRIQAAEAGEELEEYRLPEYKNVSSAEPVVIVGSGPAGMFAALRLLMEGLKPVILERGRDVHARKADVADLSTGRGLNPDSNYCFGEGGAGTFSDGKLFTRSSKRGDIREVLHQLVRFGADPSVLVDAHPHIGSDRLPAIVENIRKCIVEHGGEYHFSTRVTDLVQVNRGNRKSWKVVCGGGLVFESRSVILATGHSSREIYRLFESKGWELEAKGFALGVRAEHQQSLVDNIRYHGRYQPYMPHAEYSLVTQCGGRGVFSFCMCPGGILVPSASAPGETVLNGMSASARNSRWANAGIVCSVEPGDIPDYDRYGIFALLEFQSAVERKMYDWTGSIKAPAQRMMDFCRKRESVSLPATSYHPGAVSSPLHELLPAFVADRLREAFPAFGHNMKGYYTNDALLLACESRTSSPVRIPRNPETMSHISLEGIYPCGEGAGYAGGIVSSAVDGILVAAAAAR